MELDVPQPGVTAHGSPSPEFQDANARGTKVFFTDSQHLSSTSGSTGSDLYESTLTEEPGTGALKASLMDMTPDGFAGEVADVQGAIIGASEDGSYVYFVADGILETSRGSSKPVAGAVHGDCEGDRGVVGSAVPLCNVYVEYEGQVGLVAVLSGEDGPDWGQGCGEVRLMR